MRVLVTGSNGFVGREIVGELENFNFEVVRTGRKPAVESVNAGLKVYYAADISDHSTLSELEKIGKIDALIHAAGLAHQFGETSGEEFEKVNVRGTENICKLAVKLKAAQFILIGSTAVYGVKPNSNSSETETDENAPCRPETAYAESKLSAERAAREICERNRLALTIMRLAPVIGENAAGNSARLIEAIDGRKFLWVGDGENLKTLIYKKDAARACRMILSGKKTGTEIFNIASEPIRMLDFVGAIAENLGRKVPNLKIPTALFKIFFKLNDETLGAKKIRAAARTLEKWLSDDVYSAKKIRRAYGFEPETTIAAAIKKQVESYKQSKTE